jgi:hypothetical protein
VRKDTPSVLDLRDSRRAAMAAALAPSVRGDDVRVLPLFRV